ncbi:winged helix-turn-helix transcriptional regulator [Pseudactinotalea sp.]|uniref:winged helix-turn-helix transcriptional regulator n=1 Tax=Pseudactinotalea sp. TaxID=1926260 RepID=UPI003B3B340E
MSLIEVPVTAEGRAECGVSDVLARVGERWSLLILSLVADRAYGFNELDRAVEGLSRRILTRTLRMLERDGLVQRTIVGAVHHGAAERVEYAATPLGRSLLPLVVAVGQWARDHEADIQRARAGYSGPAVH